METHKFNIANENYIPEYEEFLLKKDILMAIDDCIVINGRINKKTLLRGLKDK